GVEITARPKINLLKSRRSVHAGCRGTARCWRGILSFTHLAREGRMTVTIGRRELLAAFGGVASAWPLAARAQRMRAIGVANLTRPRGTGDTLCTRHRVGAAS